MNRQSSTTQLRLLTEDRAFLQLDDELNEFNIFDAVNTVRREMRHSDFLAFLLNPYSNHGLKGAFGEIFLGALANSDRGSGYFVPFDSAEVRREWRNIDILVCCRASKVVFIIENKIDSTERDGQLERYWNTVHAEFPGFRVIGLYLTPEAEKPSCKDYFPIGYARVCDSLKTLLGKQKDTLPPGFKVAVEHYSAIIQQQITTMTPELRTQCWAIYSKHKHAFDLIRDCLDEWDPIREFLKGLINQYSPMLASEGDRPGYVSFYSKHWETTKFLNSPRMLQKIFFFEFQYREAQHAKGGLVLNLAIKNADNGPEPARAFKLAKEKGEPFMVPVRPTRWPVIFSKHLANPEEIDIWNSATEEKVRLQWDDFYKTKLPLLNKTIQTTFTRLRQ